MTTIATQFKELAGHLHHPTDLWTGGSYRRHPLHQHRSKPSWSRILGAAELTLKPLWAEQGNGLAGLCCEGSVSNPQVQIECPWRGGKEPNHLQIGWYGVIHDLSKELVAQDDHVLSTACQVSPRCISVKPDVSLSHKMESGSGKQLGTLYSLLAAKEDRGTEDPLDAGDQTPVFLPSLLHAEHLQHFGAVSESKCLAPLADGESCEEDQNQPVLAEWEPKVGVTEQLKPELAITTFEEKLTSWRAPHRQPAKDEWSRRKPKPLTAPFGVGSN